MDVSQYLEIFIDESAEHLQTLSDCIMELEKEPDNKDVINEIFRAAHSLKGMAGTMGFKRMQHLTHDMENVFQEVRSEKIQVDSQMIDLLFKCLDAIDGYLENIKATSDEGEEDNEVIIKELNNFLAKANGEAAAAEAAPAETEKEAAAPTDNGDHKLYLQIDLTDQERDDCKRQWNAYLRHDGYDPERVPFKSGQSFFGIPRSGGFWRDSCISSELSGY